MKRQRLIKWFVMFFVVIPFNQPKVLKWDGP